ncbi:MAG TPA: rhodanese-like domain-containing protein [Acidimicrobiales bacterium]|jgi:rhodanese-related sulfurtransferase
MSVSEISVDELADRLDAGGFLLDVRQPDEYEAGHVPGAVLIPLAEVPDRMRELPAATEMLVICRSGVRSLAAAEFLEQQQIPAVNVAGGTLAWIESGREVVTGAGAT